MEHHLRSPAVRFGIGVLAIVLALLLLPSPGLASSGFVGERPAASTVFRANPSTLSTYSENFDGAQTWQLYKGGGGFYFPSTSTAAYSGDEWSSPSTSVKIGFTSGYGGSDWGYTTAYKDLYSTFRVQTISVNYISEAYSHNNDATYDNLDAGVKIRLFDSAGTNYATYSYWFAAWYHNTNTKTPDANSRLITASPVYNQWYSFSRDPNTDWSIDWSRAALVHVQLYAQAAGTVGDSFMMYFDDFSISLLQAVGVENGYATTNDVYPEMAGTLGLGVEVYQIIKNYGGTGKDRYVLRVSGDASTRVAHQYFSYYKSAQDTYSPGYYDIGLSQDNTGKWFDFGDTMVFYLYGKSYRKVFVCSNGWVAFSYNVNGLPAPDGSWCPLVPDKLPTPDSRDGNGARIDTPDGVLSPFGRPLSFNHAGVRTGAVRYQKVGTGPDIHVSISWDQMSNQDNGYLNSVSLKLEDNGDIRYGYFTATDYYDTETRIGLEDPSGQKGMEVSLSSIMNNGGGLLLQDRNAFTEQISDFKLVVQKAVSTDLASLGFEETNLAGVNIRTSNPPPADDGSLQYVATAAGVLGTHAACYAVATAFALETLGASEIPCLLIDLGVAFAPDLMKALSKPPPDPSKYIRDDMLASEVSGSYEVPVRDENFLCGYYGGGTGQVDCAVDASVFDILDWDLPQDSQTHTLQVWFGIRVGDLSGPRDKWYYTGVMLSVGPDNTIFTDTMSRNDPATFNAPDANRAAWFPWTMDGLWHETGKRGSSLGKGFQYYSAWYGQESTGNYNTGTRNTGSLVSPLIHLLYTHNNLVYNSYFDTRTGTSYDRKFVQVSTNRGLSWVNLEQVSDSTDTMKVWYVHTLSLDSYVGKEVMIRFFFDTVDANPGSHEGWYIDDVKIGAASGGGGGGCVAEDTPILTDDGYVAVQDLKKGDIVLGYDLLNGSLVPVTFVSAKASWSEDLVVINDGALVLTAVDQPVFALRGNVTDWIRDPQDLKVGDSIFDAVNGVWIPISSIDVQTERTRVYDVVVTSPNNFVANGFLLLDKGKR